MEGRLAPVCSKKAQDSEMKEVRKIFLAVTLAITSLLAAACSSEKQIAESFISTPEKPALLITSPGFIYKSNLKKDSVPDFSALSPDGQDSALFYSSRFLRETDDSVIFDNFLSNLMNELRTLGYEVYPENRLDEFLALKKESYIFDIAQIELEEYMIPHKEREVFDDTLVYYKKFSLNAVNINTWFELSEMNSETANRVILYASHYVFDYLKGRFTQNALTGEVRFRYVLKPMVTEDIYKLASLLGKKYAGYLNDYLLNQHIATLLPEGTGPERYYHYDLKTKRLVPANNDRFQILDEGRKY
jgi:hypothetical protein